MILRQKTLVVGVFLPLVRFRQPLRVPRSTLVHEGKLAGGRFELVSCTPDSDSVGLESLSLSARRGS